MAVQAFFVHDEIEVTPGEPVSLQLTVENLGEHTESFTIVGAGLTAAWTTVTRPNVTLFGGSSDVIEVVVRPPAIHTTSAGPTTAAVRVMPQQDPDETVVAEATLQVHEFDDRRISMLQPLQRSRRRATFELMDENHGNNLASCRLHLVDPTGRVDGTFDPPAVGVAPGASSLVRLKLSAVGGRWRRADRQLDFEVEATQPDHAPAIGRGALIQPPTVPARALVSTLGVLALLVGLVAAWFGVIRPEIRDAARDAVDDRVGELAPSEPSDEPEPSDDGDDDEPDTTQPPAVVAPPADDPGVPFAVRLPLNIGVGLTGSASTAIPDDARAELTDVVIQNPNG
ncbi:MAG: hypothetical protein MUE78_01940, partial [Ilumatobacteraceae bacterium]|nr:hypothetical protein [Ilumatobacteraceae bacterium]